jgi:hypothetical protein
MQGDTYLCKARTDEAFVLRLRFAVPLSDSILQQISASSTLRLLSSCVLAFAFDLIR